MQYTKLGRTDIDVSRICLGTMTWGQQTSESVAHQQMDYALEQGVTFWDTAEMYPGLGTTGSPGSTEQIIGTWLQKNSTRRSEIILATKVTGRGSPSVRDGRGIDGQEIRQAIEGSLKRLQTDYVDLYQFHWPQRGTYQFQQHWTYRPDKQDRSEARDNLLESLQTVGDLVKEGKVRAFGVSDDTVWGVLELLRLSDLHDLPRVQSVQNEYSLLCRLFDTDWAEAAFYEDVGLLAWSPLAMGLLSGKYIGGEVPEGSRKVLLGGKMSRETDAAISATKGYVDIAKRHGLDPSQMAIAFTLARPFTTASIIGATTMDQLKTAIDAGSVTLTDEVLGEISEMHRQYPMPY